MSISVLNELHRRMNAHFLERDDAEVVNDYGDPLAEHSALYESAGVIDLSFRSRLCVVGADRVRFLHGQVTNDVKRLRPGEGCYAALTNAKGKFESDLNIHVLEEELLLEFEPGLAEKVGQRLEKYIVADDAQIVDVAPLYGLLTVQGPKAEAVVRQLGVFSELPAKPFASVKAAVPTVGDVYAINQPRTGLAGFDLFVPVTALAAVADKLILATRSVSGRACGWQALEMARIEAGIPRFGQDMDETNIPLECGIESRAVSYQKGCYIGQEVINRIHSIGQVAKELRGLRLADDLASLPAKGDKLFQGTKEVGYITSALKSPAARANVALGYVRREANEMGTELIVRSTSGESGVKVVPLPFTAA